MQLKQYACNECLYETNSKEEFKKHAKKDHGFESMCENNLIDKSLLQEVI